MKISVHLIPIPPPHPEPHPPPDTLFHYTTGDKLKQIINSGTIKPSTAQVPPHEKPVVWCSASGTWEPTATKCPVPGKIGQLITAKAQAGLARIALPAACAPHDLRQLSTLAGTTPETCMALIFVALALWRTQADTATTSLPGDADALTLLIEELGDREGGQQHVHVQQQGLGGRSAAGREPGGSTGLAGLLIGHIGTGAACADPEAGPTPPPDHDADSTSNQSDHTHNEEQEV